MANLFKKTFVKKLPRSLKLSCYCLIIIFSHSVYALQINSRLKTSVSHNQFANNSIATTDPDLGELNLRVNVEYNRQQHRVVGHYALNLSSGNRSLLSAQTALLSSPNNSENEKLFNLSSNLYTSSKQNLTQNIDRLFYGYYADNYIIKIGRQAISLGNGLIFQPFDMLNPFAPDQLDTEYKPGQEMLYGQYLNDKGGEYSLIIVPRRNLSTSAVDSKVSSYIFTGHGWLATQPINYIIGQDRNNKLIGMGTNFDIDALTIQSDWLMRQYDSLKTYSSFVINVQSSGVWQTKNVSWGVEYFYNGLGNASLTNYQQLSADLSKLLSVGQVFTVKQNYLASTFSIQLNALTTITPVIIINLDDQSLLSTISYSKNLSDNESLYINASFSPSPQNTEFGGLEINSGSHQYYAPPFTLRFEYRHYL